MTKKSLTSLAGSASRPAAQSDSQAYLDKKHFFKQLLTLYGRKTALEALQHPSVKVFRLHLSESNKPAPILDELVERAKQQGAEICVHDKKALSRISKNSKQDQGVAIDLYLPGFMECEDFLNNKHEHEHGMRVVAVDGVTNPQNLGMIVRSVCASGHSILLLPRSGCANIDALVIKASAGSLFRAGIVRCDTLSQGLTAFKQQGYMLAGLDAKASCSLSDYRQNKPTVYILGNETEGLSKSTIQSCDTLLSIPLYNGVESLNVAVTAALVAFKVH